MRVASVLALSFVATIFACTLGVLVVGAWLLDVAAPMQQRRRPAPAHVPLGRGWMLGH